MNYKQIKQLINKIEKKEKELATYKAKVNKIEAEINELKNKLNSFLNNNQNINTI